jgi:mono/diheme cytochrome c family protein
MAFKFVHIGNDPIAGPHRWSTLLIVALGAICMAFLTSSAAWGAETPEQRGAYLVNGVGACGNCHSPKGADGLPTEPALTGAEMREAAFVAYPPNLTSAPDSGLGRWSVDQIVTAVREGRTPDGAILRPPMPVAFYRRMSDSDARAIAAYLKSTAPVENQVPEAEYKIPTPTSYGPPVGSSPDVAREDTVAYGAYLGQIGHCLLCHTPRGANGQQDYANKSGAGGREVEGVVSANITPDKATGIGKWTDQQIRVALTTGVRPDGAQLAPPMPWYYFKNMSDADIGALTAWLRSLKPVVNAVR